VREHRIPLDDGGTAHVRFTDTRDGDLAISAPQPDLDERRARVAPLPWTWLRQVHGRAVVTVTAPGEHSGTKADGAVTLMPAATLAVHTADCAPIALVSPAGVVGVAHAGWRGLAAGVVEATVAAMRELGADPVHALVGPCIHAPCYAFGAGDLDAVAAGLGDEVRAMTSDGAPALDLLAGVRAALRAAGVDPPLEDPPCTACSSTHFSHRARGQVQRHALVVWMEEP
jgi:YfiH family protein